MKKFKLYDTLGGWLVFVMAAVTYLLTMEPTASFWDCGEFIASAFKLDVGHPPGAPFFMLMGRFFSLFASDTAHVAVCVNAVSALASAFTILFLFWTITALARKLVDEITVANGIAILGAGFVGSLAYTWSDSFWFSAVEGEVYASSSLFTAVVFWLILKWDECAEEAHSDKWLILIAYLMGLSIGVHLLNLLTIPAIVLVYYFHRYEFSWKGVFGALLASGGILLGVLYGIIQGIPTIAGWFELLFVNGLGLGYNTGLFIYLILLVGALIWSIYESQKSIESGENAHSLREIISFVLAFSLAGVPFIKASVFLGVMLILAVVGVLVYLFKQRGTVPSRILNTSMLMIAMIVVGYLSYALLVIRSSADPPMDQNSPDNVFALKSYLNRDQYGAPPLLYGQFYNAPVKLDEDRRRGICTAVRKQGDAIYAPTVKTNENDKDHYDLVGYKLEPVYDERFCTFFPRMHSSEGHHIEAYKQWGEVKGNRVRYDYCGQKKSDICPTFGENLRFFFRYQCNFMYWRYFMWNFVGRQDDMQCYGEILHGNWITGISFIDQHLLFDVDKAPAEMRDNKGHNVYYMLPLLLGVLGICWQCGRKRGGKNVGWKSFAITFSLFFLTGLAIVIYLNQVPNQPRERDYSYVGSFYAFCIWIGLGVLALYDIFQTVVKSDRWRPWVASLACLFCLIVPLQMVSQTWDDHDRSNRYTTRDFGSNYLNSCEDQAILFTNGDNDTFPLWYCQEVEGIRTDVRACNLMYLQTEWYIDQMKRPYYKSPAFPISWKPKDYRQNKHQFCYVNERTKEPLSVKQSFDFLLSDDPRTKMNDEDYLPSSKIFLYAPDSSKIFLRSSGRYLLNEMMTMEVLSTNAWQRPVYITAGASSSAYLGLDAYLELTGMNYRFTPVRSEDGRPRVNTAVMYDNMMNKFKYGNLEHHGLYIDETTMRMCYSHRNMFMRLAEALVTEGKKDSALLVLDFCQKVLPAYNVPYDASCGTMASLYCRLGEVDKGTSIFATLADNAVEFLEWGSSLPTSRRKSINDELRQRAYVLDYAEHHFGRYERKDLYNKYLPYCQKYIRQNDE